MGKRSLYSRYIQLHKIMKDKRKLVTMEEYSKEIERISRKKLSFESTFAKMLDYCVTVRLKNEKLRTPTR